MKPVPRWQLLAGKYIGALLLVGAHAALFVGGTWAALGLRTDVWRLGYLMAWPLLLVQFAAFYGFSTLVAVTFRSTVATLLGTIGCWLTCSALNLGYHAVLAAPYAAESRTAVSPAPSAGGGRTPVVTVTHEVKTTVAAPNATPDANYSPALVMLLRSAYWVLPKPVDFAYVTFQALDAEKLVGAPFYYHPLMDRGALDLRWSVLTSLLFAAALVWLAAKQFADTDY
jgi:ABC-type transport system involved in multi-copper enzyme maturation permease subunit